LIRVHTAALLVVVNAAHISGWFSDQQPYGRSIIYAVAEVAFVNNASLGIDANEADGWGGIPGTVYHTFSLFYFLPEI